MKSFHISIYRSACIVFIAFIACIVRGQVTDNFTDGDFTDNPAWFGDTAHFEVNASGQLHLRSAGSDTSVLATRSMHGMETEWSFWMKLSFNTSSNNFAKVYLEADTSGLLLPLNGYYLQAGGGDDSVLIIRQTGTSVQTIYRFKSYKTMHSTNTLRIKITRDDSGFWTVMIDTTGGFNYINDGSFFDDSPLQTRWFGLVCRYTSSNAAKFYFDDFYAGPVLRDTVPPQIVSVSAESQDILRINFSEPLQKQAAEDLENYLLMAHQLRPDSVVQDINQSNSVHLFLHDPMADRTFDSLQIRNILDLPGNRINDTLVKFWYYMPGCYDILISEILADPDPPVGLPDGEFVELYNRSDFPISLGDWTFKYGSYSKMFPAMTIPPKEHLLIAKDSAYLDFGRCAVLLTSSYSLTNEGTTLTLYDSRNHIIHSVTYSPDWYRGSFKEEGGWSLEMADPFNPCGCMDNWWPSKDGSGGTPGRVNSMMHANPDQTAPVVVRAVISDSALLEVTFSETMDTVSLISNNAWAIGHSGGFEFPANVCPVPPGYCKANLSFSAPFDPGITYSLRIAGNARDCSGNRCDTSLMTRFAFPESVAARDVILNEILSNPASGGARFVELYNRSEKIIDLQTLVLACGDVAEGFLSEATPLTTSGYLLFPGDYAAFTSNPGDLEARYRVAFPGTLAKMTGFPVFGDDSGTVILARKDNLEIIDRMKYEPGMHYPLLTTTEGVSLERTSPDLPSDDKENWHSAAESRGYATPGYQNSHWLVPADQGGGFFINPQVFSPDNDGRDDLLTVTLRENDPDCAINLAVYDSRGRFVIQLANNVLAGSENVFIWDGINGSRCKEPMGIYILFAELTWPDGTVRKMKKTCVLAGMLK